METDYRAAQVTFEAPADGYQDSYFVQMNHDDPGWFDNIQKDVFPDEQERASLLQVLVGFWN